MLALSKSPVHFDKELHKYTLDGKELSGITSTLIVRAYPDTYTCPSGMDEERWHATLQDAAMRGTAVHEAIELYDDLGIVTPDIQEVEDYITMMCREELIHEASEYIVSDEEHYATAIDKVYTDGDGNIVLADIKCTSTLHHENVTLQLNICKRFFELQNPDLHVDRLVCLWFHNGTSRCVACGMLEDAMIDDLIAADIADAAFDVTAYYGGLPMRVADVEDEIIRIERAAKELKQKSDDLKAGLLSLMDEHNIKSYETSRIKLTRVLPSKKKVFDAKRFQQEHGDLYESYQEEKETSSSLRLTIKK